MAGDERLLPHDLVENAGATVDLHNLQWLIQTINNLYTKLKH